MRGSRKFCQRGSIFDSIFLVDKGREDPSTTTCISSLSLCGSCCGDPESFVREGPNMTTFFYDKGREDPIYHYKRAFRWRADDGPILNAGLVALRFSTGSDLYR